MKINDESLGSRSGQTLGLAPKTQTQASSSKTVDRTMRGAAWAFAVASLCVVIGIVADCVSTAARADDSVSKQETAAKADAQNDVQHGKYLVHHVAKCIECHAPRNARGTIDESRLLTGAVIPIVGPESAPPWAAEAPSIAGLGNYEESFVRHLLSHGARPDGTHPKSPMPSFKLNPLDASSVIAYLKSL